MTTHLRPITLHPHDSTEGEPPAARPDGLPDGYRVTPGGVERRVDVDGEPEWRWLCSPLRVLSLTRGRDGTGWGRLVEVEDPDGGTHRWAIPGRLLVGDGAELRGSLAELGLRMASDRGARDALTNLLAAWYPTARAETSGRLGWADERCAAFILGDGRVIGAADVVYQHAGTATAAAEMKAAGTLEGWRERVAAPCVGNPLLLVSVSLAFAGSLLEPLGLDGGGLHLRGASSRGKSTAQRVAVSVWGSPRFMQSWRATANGLEGLATACNATVLALDEMGEIGGRDMGPAAYMLANGTGKARADRSGQARTPATWRTMVLSSGEVSLADKMAEAGERKRAGQEVRLLDVAADTRRHGTFDELHGAPHGAAFSDRMKAATAEHYGTPGPKFVEAFVSDREEMLQGVREATASFRAMAVRRYGIEGDGQEERAVKALGLVAAAGEMATLLGLTGWAEGAALDAALEVLGLWINGRGGLGSSEAREAVSRLRAFLSAHSEARFRRIGSEGTGSPIQNRAGFRDDETFYVTSRAWKEEVHAGVDAARAAVHVAAANFLHRGDGRGLTRKGPRVKGEVRERVYAVRAEILEGGDG